MRLHSGALLEVQCLPAVSLERPELSLDSLISQSQDIPEAKHVSKFNGFFMLIPSASISLGLEIPEWGGTFQAHWDDEGAWYKVPKGPCYASSFLFYHHLLFSIGLQHVLILLSKELLNPLLPQQACTPCLCLGSDHVSLKGSERLWTSLSASNSFPALFTYTRSMLSSLYICYSKEKHWYYPSSD